MQLRKFQRQDVEKLKKAKLRALIANSQGTGKTCTAVTAVSETREWSLPAVVVCPASVTRNWAREIKMWTEGIRTVRIEDMTTPISLKQRDTIFIVSWSLLDSRAQELIDLGVKVLIADEVHYAKNPDAIRTMAVKELAKTCAGVLLLSGTPVVNAKEDLDELYDILGTTTPLMLRRLLEDVAPDVPTKSRAYVYVQLRPNQQQEYKEADEEFIDWLAKEKDKLLGAGMGSDDIERVMAAEALIKIGYLRRMIGEFKVAAASDWIARASRLGEPVVVFCEHQIVISKLSKALRKQRIRFAVIDGATPGKDRQKFVDMFQRYELPVIIGTKAAKEGITLTAARHLLFVERYYTSAEEEQAEDRVRRLGQLSKTTIWFLHVPNTVDDRVDAIVKSKRSIVREAIGSKDIFETDVSNVAAMLRAWDQQTVDPNITLTDLGLGEQLDPLPSPNATHAVIFQKPRWSHASAAGWCKMHGYTVTKVFDYSNRLKVVVHPPALFVTRTYKRRRISKDVHIIVGTRQKAAKLRKLRAVKKVKR